MLRALLAAALFWPALASAAVSSAPEVDHETFFLLGWNKGCSVALAHYAYPKVGDAIADEPVMTRIGTLTIEPGEEKFKQKWAVEADGRRSFDPALARKAKADLARAGYNLSGYKEIVRPDPVVDKRDLQRLILTTETFKSRSTGPFPGPGWRMAAVYYNTTATCAMILYRQLGQRKDFYTPALIRIETPGIRRDRALAHITNGLLLLEQGERTGAVAETAIAARMAPEYAEARYKHAALLNLDGQTDAAVDELAAALQLEPTLREKAAADADFESLKGFPRFDQLMGR